MTHSQDGNVEVDDLWIHGTVLTQDARGGTFHDGAVAVREGRIVDVGPTDEVKRRCLARHVRDVRGHAVLPGFVDAYTHAGHGMSRGSYDPARGMTFGPLTWHATTPRWWYAEARLAAAERMRFGVTTALAIVGGTPARVDEPAYALAVARANDDAGTRVVVGVGPPDPICPHIPWPWTGTAIGDDGSTKTVTFDYDQAVTTSDAIIDTVHGSASGRIRACWAPPYLLGRSARHRRFDHAVPTLREAAAMRERAEDVVQRARSRGVLVHSHVFVGSVAFVCEAFGEAAVLDLLGPDVVFAHANGMSPHEVEILGGAQVAIAVVPSTHENVWYGVAPALDLARHGATIAVTTDGSAPYCTLDLLSTTAPFIWNEWRRTGDLGDPRPEQVLRAITIDAARALGWDDEIGSIEVGKQADLVAIDLNRPHLTPGHDVEHQLVHHASGHDVAVVAIAGRIVFDGVHTTVDVAAALDEVRHEDAAAKARWAGSRSVETRSDGAR